ncbi:hypothetical protein CYYG_00030 [Cyanophage SS120-1]|uniref:Bacteriophage T7 tail fibre protein-like N-terminal domain-containing protein n=1 Tax=Cyanophage SS120-1 TaxID=616674 RepID=M1UAC7_9CAUD|nr:hypothetical protein CYYG_00030 [Cyanophage SS120-1]AGG54531.1 hypothetical protein CYYG_00030 [Cyanophage SS120-1]
MAVTSNSYTGNGSTTNYSITFPYIATTDIKAQIDGIATTAFSLANATTVQFNSAPANGTDIVIFRETDDTTIPATFYAGSSIRSQDLNNNFTQTLYIGQETAARALTTLGGTMIGDLEMAKGSKVVFEGSTDDAHETTLTVTNPTADRTLTLPNVSGNVITSGDTGTVTKTLLAADSVDSSKIENATIVNADISGSAAIAGSKITAATTSAAGTLSAADKTKLDGIETGATGDQTNAEIRTAVEAANDSNVFTDSDHTKLNGIETAATADQTVSEIKTLIAGSPLDQNHLASNSVSNAAIADAELSTLAGMQSGTASILAGGTALTSTLTELNQLDGKTLGETTLTTNSDTAIPTSKAVNDQILAVTNALGGFVAIADELNFPNANPDPSDGAGTVVSISDAGGVVVNGSGVASIANGTVGNSTVTINGFPSTLYSKTLAAGVGLQVQTTTTLNTYTYHKLLAKEADVEQLSGDINDFNERYRIANSAPGSNNDEGDLWYDTANDKMKVYDGSAWGDVASTGSFFINTLSSYSGTGGNSASFNGSAYRFVLSNPPNAAEQLVVSINGVIQKPNSGTGQPSEGFSINGTSILFSAAPATGSDWFIITIGSSVTVGTPSANTVSTSILQNGSVTNDKVNAGAAIDVSKLSGVMPLAGGTITGDVVFDNATNAGNDLTWDMSDNALEFDDNVKATFGDGGDLQIYHDGSHSYIQDAGTGELRLRADAGIIRITKDDTETLAAFNVDGASELWYDNVKEFETKSGGVKLLGHSECAVNALGNVNSNPTFDFTVANYITLTLTGNVTVQNPTTESVGQSGSIIITQDGTGSRTCAWSNQFKWTGGAAPTLSTAANAVDRIDYLVVAADQIHCVASLDVK